jgi:hypothetical protein
MNALLPIIRRARRPLLPPEEIPRVAAPAAVEQPQNTLQFADAPGAVPLVVIPEPEPEGASTRRKRGGAKVPVNVTDEAPNTQP